MSKILHHLVKSDQNPFILAEIVGISNHSIVNPPILHTLHIYSYLYISRYTDVYLYITIYTYTYIEENLVKPTIWWNTQNSYFLALKLDITLMHWFMHKLSFPREVNNILMRIVYNAFILYNTRECPFLRSVPSVCPSQILHPTCVAYISWNNGQILMFKVSKWPYRSSRHDEIICRWRHNPPGGENLN